MARKNYGDKTHWKNKAEIIWEWSVWNHLIQDYDNNQLNFGKISAHPELVDINFLSAGNLYFQNEDWLHANSIAYNEELDQIIISIRSYCEIWIIDHSTNSEEAKTNCGGNSNRGGSLLYRWGNPQTYQRGDAQDQQLFYQHDAHWIPKGLPGAGNILLFNNGLERNDGNYSEVYELDILYNFTGHYILDSLLPYTSNLPKWKYPKQPDKSFFSHNTSSARRMPNGNTLIVEGAKGNIFEVDSIGTMVWKYISPINNGVSEKQGEIINNNAIFNATKYPKNHPAFKNKKMKTSGYIEKNPLQIPCVIYPEKK